MKYIYNINFEVLNAHVIKAALPSYLFLYETLWSYVCVFCIMYNYF